VSLVIGVKS